MRCSKCGTERIPGKKFCAECGRLTQDCVVQRESARSSELMEALDPEEARAIVDTEIVVARYRR
jgi:uncharacterized membrane protein YvbJ